MRFAIGLIVGAALVFGMPGMPAIYGVVGVMVGLLVSLADAKWPKVKPTYIEPASRPKPTTPAAAVALAGIVAVGSGLIALVVWKVVSPNARTYAWFGYYLAALGLGTAIGMVLTARQVSETHNRWLAAMVPDAQREI